MSRSGRAGWSALLGVATLAIAIDLTLLFLAMREVMSVGGSCGDGGPYVIETACPDGVGAILSGGFPALFVCGALMSIGAAKVRAPQLVMLTWPALFLSMGWNFLQDGTGPSGITGFLVCGVVFLIMGGGPLLFVIPIMRRSSGHRRSPLQEMRHAQLLERVQHLNAGAAPLALGLMVAEEVPHPRDRGRSLRTSTYVLTSLVLAAVGVLMGVWLFGRFTAG